MKVKVLRSLLEQVAEMQRNLGDEVTSQALDELGEVLRASDAEEVTKMVERVQQRREDTLSS